MATSWTNQSATGRISSTEYDWDDAVMTWDGAGDWDAGQAGITWTNETKNTATYSNQTKN